MTDADQPLITFPCDYPIKVIGDMTPDFKEFVTRIARRHDPQLSDRSISVNSSRNGRFLSVRLVIRATGESQIASLFAELKESGRVRMVL
jgi:putative lipoic acid-binding regulatory protein